MTKRTAKHIAIKAAVRCEQQTMGICDRPSGEQETRPGEKVKYAYPEAGLTGHQKPAKLHLTPNQLYTVKALEVGGWSSTVELEEFPGVWFNTVFFCNA